MKPTRAYTKGNFGQIHYCTLGEGTPLVLMHQSPTCMVQFDKVWHLLAERGYQVIGIDLPGFGGSSSRIPDYSIHAHARHVLQLMDRLEISDAHLVGFSMTKAALHLINQAAGAVEGSAIVNFVTFGACGEKDGDGAWDTAVAQHTPEAALVGSRCVDITATFAD